MAEQVEFGIRIPEIFKRGFAGYTKNALPLTLAALCTLGVYGLFRFQAQAFLDDGHDFRALVLDLGGLILGGTIAYPWYAYALEAARGEKVDLRAPFAHPKRFAHQAMASLFFWAGVLFGLRYGRALFFLPAIAVLVLYAFHGYVIADTPADKEGVKGGTLALGTSVRLGDKRRFGLFAIACLLMMFNFLGAMFGVARLENEQPFAYPILVVGLAITSSITLVGGAYIYDELKERLGDHLYVPTDGQPKQRSSRKRKKKGKKRG